jgi:hypothetical protein
VAGARGGRIGLLWRAQRGTALDVGFLLVVCLLYFWQIVVARDHLIPYDLIDQHYMFQVWVHRWFTGDGSPWWAPPILGGYPIVADPQTALFYPPNIAMHLASRAQLLPYVLLELQTVVHYFWAALGTYVLARRLTGSRAGAVIAALTYAFGSFYAWHSPHLWVVAGLSWLPWVLLTYGQALLTRQRLWIGLAAAAFAMVVFSGHALTMLQTGYTLVALTAIMAWREWETDRRAAVATVVVGVGTLALGAAIALVQLLPSWELSEQSDRVRLTFEEAAGSAVQPQHLLTMLVPNFFSYDGPAPYWGVGDIAETNLYVGLVPLLLAGLAVARGRPEDRRAIGFLVAGVLLALAFSFGGGTWLYRIAFDVLPLVDRVRRPANFVALAQLALALLAAYGVRLLEIRPEVVSGEGHTLLGWLRWTLAGALAAIALAGIALAHQVGTAQQQVLTAVVNGLVIAGIVLLATWVVLRWFAGGQIALRTALAALVLITTLDLGTAFANEVHKNHAMHPASYIGLDWAGSPDDPTVRRLLAEAAAQPARARVLPRAVGSIWANGPLVWGLESADGYSVLWPTAYQQLYGAATADINGPLLDRMNVGYVLTPGPIETTFPGADPAKFRLLSDGTPHIYANLAVRPRVWVARDVVVQPAEQTLAWMREHAAMQGDTVVLDEEPPEGARPLPASGRAEIVTYDATRVVINVSMPGDGFVVLADTWFPGWRAEVDGDATHVYRADHAFRAVWVPAGEHDVVFTYTSSTLRTGAILSLVALVALMAMLVTGALPWLRQIGTTARRETRRSN